MVAPAFCIETVADAQVVPPGVGPGTMSFINEEAFDGRVILGPFEITSNAADATNVVVPAVGTHGHLPDKRHRCNMRLSKKKRKVHQRWALN